MTKEEALKTYFGYDAFRGGQEPVINALLSGRDALAIMPTGAGSRSATKFQLCSCRASPWWSRPWCPSCGTR